MFAGDFRKTGIYPFFLLFLIIAFHGCSSKHIPTKAERVHSLQTLLKNANVKKETIQTPYFNHFIIMKKPLLCNNKTAHIYIEGDGLAWITRTQPSEDPTPIDPLALKLFLKDPHKCTFYIARPCQYIMGKRCNRSYWTSKRFSSEVIQSFNIVLDNLKKQHGIKNFILFGYSGGGAVATLLTAWRKDIQLLVTVAGNLDTDKWTKIHYISPLSQSLNPASYAHKIYNIPQIHLIGEQDSNIPPSVAQSFAQKFPKKSPIKLKIYNGFSHHCCWAEHWKEILKEIQ